TLTNREPDFGPRAAAARSPAGAIHHAGRLRAGLWGSLDVLHRRPPYHHGGRRPRGHRRARAGALGDPRVAARRGGRAHPGRRPRRVRIAAASRGAGRGRAVDAFSVRKEAKTHGTGQRIEGCFFAGAAVVIVEDVITTGRSALEAIGAVEAAGGRVLGVLAVVDREEGGRAALEQAGHAVAALVSATELGLR